MRVHLVNNSAKISLAFDGLVHIAPIGGYQTVYDKCKRADEHHIFGYPQLFIYSFGNTHLVHEQGVT